jgi:hypothetical protein
MDLIFGGIVGIVGIVVLLYLFIYLFIVCLTIIFLRRSRLRQSQSAPRPAEPGLRLVHDAKEENETERPIDIIAIHGLDTRSPDTWTWQDPKDLRKQVNWLEDSKMLPSKVGRARIFTCDWPADLFQQSIPTTLEESARFLIRSISQHLAAERQVEDRPIFFIASCLGGIILIKALEINRRDSHEGGRSSIIEATRGVVFLATPFLGTAFKDMPDLSLKVWAALKDQRVTALINYTKQPTPCLNELVRGFIELKVNKRYHVFTF